MNKILLIVSIIILPGLLSCHQIYKSQWVSATSNNVSKIKLINEIKSSGLRTGLVEATNRMKFPNTLILMRELPVQERSVDLGLRLVAGRYFIDVWGGYGVENRNFDICEKNIERLIASGNLGVFEKTNQPIIP